MCEVCEVLTIESDKKIIWSVRSTFADDNIHEVLDKDYTGEFSDDCAYFELHGHKYEGKTMVSVLYRQELSKQGEETVIISPFSETIQFNFCPICGKQISESVKEFKDYYKFHINIK